MATSYNPLVVRAGLLYYYDASNPRCYPTYGTTLYSLHNAAVMGTMVGDVWMEGNGISAFKFNGNVDRIETPITATASMSYDIWFNLKYINVAEGKANPWNTLFDSGAERPLIGFLNGYLYVYPDLNWPAITVASNTWHHLQVVITTNTLCNVWLDGVKVVTNAALTTALATGAITHWLGGDSSVESSDAWIAMAAVYDVALTDAEIMQNHYATSSRFSSNSLLGSKNNPATSPQQLQDAGKLTGSYWIQGTGMSAALPMIVRMNYIDNKPWVLGFASPFRSTATINLVGNSIPWKGFAVQQQGTGAFRQTAYFTTNQAFNTRTDATLTTGGTRIGYRVFIGGAGGMGIYTTSQTTCNWSSTNLGAVGAGYNGATCGTFPNDLVWGTGNNSSATYDNMSGNWEVLIWWE